MKDEGYIKFRCNWTESPVEMAPEDFEALNHWRNILYSKDLIGVYPNEVGFGNISIRKKDSSQFFITGSGTGHIRKLTEEHYALVTGFDIQKNTLHCTGKIKASSESLSHAVIYKQQDNAGAVIHVHHFELWRTLKDKVPTTNEKARYGTPEMANEIIKLIKKFKAPEKKIIIMGGHEEGIITFGKNLNEAGSVLLYYL